MSEPIRLSLETPDIILMQRPESPALVHGGVARDAHPGLEPLWEDTDGPRGTARVERRGDDVVAVASLTTPVEVQLEVALGLPDELAAGLERRPTALVMMYPDDESRAAALSDFRTGGVRGDWVSLGIVLPIATTDPLRADAAT